MGNKLSEDLLINLSENLDYNDIIRFGMLSKYFANIRQKIFSHEAKKYNMTYLSFMIILSKLYSNFTTNDMRRCKELLHSKRFCKFLAKRGGHLKRVEYVNEDEESESKLVYNFDELENEYYTHELCAALCARKKNNIFKLEHIPQYELTEDLIITYMNTHNWNIRLVPHDKLTFNICQLYIKYHPDDINDAVANVLYDRSELKDKLNLFYHLCHEHQTAARLKESIDSWKLNTDIIYDFSVINKTLLTYSIYMDIIEHYVKNATRPVDLYKQLSISPIDIEIDTYIRHPKLFVKSNNVFVYMALLYKFDDLNKDIIKQNMKLNSLRDEELSILQLKLNGTIKHDNYYYIFE
jgi:hypothetical protein